MAAIRKQGDVLILREPVPGETSVFAGMTLPDFDKMYQKEVDGDRRSLVEQIEEHAKNTPTKPAIIEMSRTENKTVTYSELVESGQSLARALLDGGFFPELDCLGTPRRFTAIYLYHSQTTHIICDLASFYMDSVNTALYAQPYDQLVFFLNEVGFNSIITEPEYAKQLVKLIKEKTARPLKNFIMSEELDKDTLAEAKALGITIYSLHELMEKGRVSKTKLPESRIEHPCLLEVTNGFKGKPTGVVLDQKCMLVFKMVMRDYFSSKDTMVVNVNCAYYSGKLIDSVILLNGGTLYTCTYYTPGDLMFSSEKGSELLRKANPTFMLNSPIFLHKFHEMALELIKKMPPAQAADITAAIEEKIKQIKATKQMQHPDLDKRILPLKEMIFGTNVTKCLYAGAKVREDTLWFIRAVLACPLTSIYGQTESGCVCSWATTFDPYGSIGRPLPGFEFKIIDCEEAGYTVLDKVNGKPAPRGELYVRGPTTMLGYLGNSAATRDVFSEDRWLRTRDIVQLNPEDMSMIILGRANGAAKIANEEFISFEALEQRYLDNPYVSQIYVHVASDRDHIVALVVPKKEMVLEWAKKKGVAGDYAELCKSADLCKDLVSELWAFAELKRFNSDEHLRDICLTPEPFTKENGMLNNSGRMRRSAIIAKYGERINALFAK